MRPRQNLVVFSCRVWVFAVIGFIVGQFVHSGADWALLVKVLTTDAVEVDHLTEVNVVERIRIDFNHSALCVKHIFFQYLLSLLKKALYMLRKLYFLYYS